MRYVEVKTGRDWRRRFLITPSSMAGRDVFNGLLTVQCRFFWMTLDCSLLLLNVDWEDTECELEEVPRVELELLVTPRLLLLELENRKVLEELLKLLPLDKLTRVLLELRLKVLLVKLRIVLELL